MNKLKNVFQRSQKKTTEDRRPEQFLKRHSSINTTNSAATVVTAADINALLGNDINLTLQQQSPPCINLSELSEMEKPTYESWWKDLDPFNLNKIDNHTILNFLNGCKLQDNKLEQILALFETAGDGLDKVQFFAMLRLIAHAQNGRKINRALVYLGAPIPHFHTNAIDALIKTGNSPICLDEEDHHHHILESIPNSVYIPPQTPQTPQKRNWVNHERPSQQLVESRRSYIGPFTAHTPIPTSTSSNSNTPSNNDNNTNIDYFYPLAPIMTSPAALYHTTSNSAAVMAMPSWIPSNTSTSSVTPDTKRFFPPITTTTSTANVHQTENKYNTHFRSKSTGNITDFTFPNPYFSQQEQQQQQPSQPSSPLQSSRSSLSLHDRATSQPLLLTQKFVYESPSLRKQKLLSNNSNNPFSIPTTESSETLVTAAMKESLSQPTEILSPFDDEYHSDEDLPIELSMNNNSEKPYSTTASSSSSSSSSTTTPSSFHEHHTDNLKPNSYSIPPPPVPNQSTKPTFPKYTRTNSFLSKPSHSTAVHDNNSSRSGSTRHQKHNSTTTTVFY